MKQDDWGPWNGSKQGGGNQYPPPGGGYPPQGGGYPPQGGGYPPGYPPPGGYGYRPPGGGGGMAIASLVLGILSLISLFFAFLPVGFLILSTLAIIFGAVSKKQGYLGGMATAGIVMGVISLALGLLFWIACMTICAAVATPAFWF